MPDDTSTDVECVNGVDLNVLRSTVAAVQQDPANLERLKRLAEFSPVYSTITNGAKVDIDILPA